jgi:hypothetical protein
MFMLSPRTRPCANVRSKVLRSLEHVIYFHWFVMFVCVDFQLAFVFSPRTRPCANIRSNVLRSLQHVIFVSDRSPLTRERNGRLQITERNGTWMGVCVFLWVFLTNRRE